MRVIKLGGSLMNDTTSLPQCLTTIKQKYKNNVVIVPGGGVFADQIRLTQQQWKFSDETAHQMAILAMKQMALFLKSLKPFIMLGESVAALQDINLDRSVAIWSPDIKELNAFSINASWEITSDSLAAWLATRLSATELILVKSAEIPPNLSLQQMQENGLVDRAFHSFAKNSLYEISIVNKHQFNEYNFT